MSVAVGPFSGSVTDKVTAYHPSASIPTSAGGGLAAEANSVGGGLPLCAKCHLPVEDKYVVRVRGRSWHSRCALCSICGCALSEFCFVLEGRLLCRQDYHRLYATKCATCKQPMLSHELCMRTGPNEVHHVSCFICSVCREPLVVGVEYARDPITGAPICKNDCLARSSPSAGGSGEIATSTVTGVPMAPSAPQNFPGKRGRTTLSADQRARLQQVFETNPKPGRKVREALGAEFGLSMRVIQVWFQNQRAREKKLSATSVSSASPAAVPKINTSAAPSGLSSVDPPSIVRPGMKKTKLFQWNDPANFQQWQ
ncbi:hypothetical protein Aperf_G00000050429 [Anoplocephala perfoliata]